MLHVVDIAPLDGSDPVVSAKAIINELAEYDPELVHKPRWLVLNKIDMLPDEEARQQAVDNLVKGLDWQGKVYTISAIKAEGTQQLCYDLMQLIDEMKEAETQPLRGDVDD